MNPLPPKELAKEFIDKLEKTLGIELIYVITGSSLKKEKFKWGHSDVDIIFLAKDKHYILGYKQYLEAGIISKEMSEKYYYPDKYGRKFLLVDFMTFGEKAQRMMRGIVENEI